MTNYPDTTWPGDPTAPWNDPEDYLTENDWEAQNEFSLDWDCDEYWKELQ